MQHNISSWSYLKIICIIWKLRSSFLLVGEEREKDGIIYDCYMGKCQSKNRNELVFICFLKQNVELGMGILVLCGSFFMIYLLHGSVVSWKLAYCRTNLEFSGNYFLDKVTSRKLFAVNFCFVVYIWIACTLIIFKKKKKIVFFLLVLFFHPHLFLQVIYCLHIKVSCGWWD